MFNTKLKTIIFVLKIFWYFAACLIGAGLGGIVSFTNVNIFESVIFIISGVVIFASIWLSILAVKMKAEERGKDDV